MKQQKVTGVFSSLIQARWLTGECLHVYLLLLVCLFLCLLVCLFRGCLTSQQHSKLISRTHLLRQLYVQQRWKLQITCIMTQGQPVLTLTLFRQMSCTMASWIPFQRYDSVVTCTTLEPPWDDADGFRAESGKHTGEWTTRRTEVNKEERRWTSEARQRAVVGFVCLLVCLFVVLFLRLTKCRYLCLSCSVKNWSPSSSTELTDSDREWR